MENEDLNPQCLDIQIGFHANRSLYLAIERLADEEKRSRAAMVRRLIKEALHIREENAKRAGEETSSDCDTVITTPPVRGIDFFDVSDLGSGEEITKELESRGVHPSDVISIGDGINTCRIWYRI